MTLAPRLRGDRFVTGEVCVRMQCCEMPTNSRARHSLAQTRLAVDVVPGLVSGVVTLLDRGGCLHDYMALTCDNAVARWGVDT